MCYFTSFGCNYDHFLITCGLFTCGEFEDLGEKLKDPLITQQKLKALRGSWRERERSLETLVRILKILKEFLKLKFLSRSWIGFFKVLMEVFLDLLDFFKDIHRVDNRVLLQSPTSLLPYCMSHLYLLRWNLSVVNNNLSRL